MFGSEQQSAQLRALVDQLIRVGTVTSLDEESAMARVRFQDRNDVVSYRLPVLVRNSVKNKDYWMPDINEQVVCLFLPIGIEQGFIIGSFYSRVTAPPVVTGDKRHVVFDDGTWLEYDRTAHNLTAEIKGTASIHTTGNATAAVDGNLSATVKGNASISVNGDVTESVGGNMTATVGSTTDITSPTINLNGTVNVTGALNLAGPLAAAPGSAGGGASIQGGMDVQDGITADGVQVTGGDVVADGVSLKNHPHTDSVGGTTSPPQPTE